MITVAGALVDDINLLDFEGNDKLISYMFDTLKESQKKFTKQLQSVCSCPLRTTIPIWTITSNAYLPMEQATARKIKMLT
jgi:hypothetical protein